MSDLMARRARTTALKGGLPGRTDSHATCRLDRNRSITSLITSSRIVSGWIRPSTGTRGNGNAISTRSAIPRPLTTVAMS